MADLDPQQALSKRVTAALVAAFGEGLAGTDPLVRPSANPQFGDYQINVAMSLAKRLKRKPREVASELVDRLELDDLCEAPEIAGPGFINCRLTDDYLASIAASLLGDPRVGVQTAAKTETIVVDYSAPNVAKEMHVGHLRSTIIGDALARVFAFLGHRVIRQNHIGDWGTQFGMLIEYLVAESGDGPAIGADTEIADLNRFYQKAKERFDADATFAERARRRVVALQSGDAATLAIWQHLVDESERHFRGTYDRLRVALTDADIQPESAYNEELPGLVAWLEEQGLTEVSDGALCLFPEGFETKDGTRLPMIVRKSDGGYLYATTDLAALRHRVEKLGADRIVYVTDARQSQHFAMLFRVAELTGWLASGTRVAHVPFGTILGEDNRPFKTRSGEVVKLDALLDEALDRATRLATESSAALDPGERERIAALVSIGAVKYADLSGDRVKDYVFSWDRMMAMDGNTAPYLQYAYARIRSIFRRAERPAEAVAAAPVSLGHEKERALFLRLLQLGPTIRGVAESLEPHRLCTYLYDVATAFSGFYESCSVLRADSEEILLGRLALCDLTARTLELGLGLLGIEVVERM